MATFPQLVSKVSLTIALDLVQAFFWFFSPSTQDPSPSPNPAWAPASPILGSPLNKDIRMLLLKALTVQLALQVPNGLIKNQNKSLVWCLQFAPVSTCFLCTESLPSGGFQEQQSPWINICDKDQNYPYSRPLNEACKTNPEIMINQTTV